MLRECFTFLLRSWVLALGVLLPVAFGGARADPAVRPVPFSRDVSPPAFSRIVIGKDGASTFEGRGSPGSQVVIHRDGRLVAAATVGRSGNWTVTLSQSLASGEHRLGSAASAGADVVYGDDVRIVVPDALSDPVVLTYDAPIDPDGVRRRAEQLATAASERFSEFLHAGQKEREDVQVVEIPARKPSEHSDEGGESWLQALVRSWLDRVRQDYQREVIGKLSSERPGARADAASGDSSFLSFVWDWLERAARTYQREIIAKLSVPTERDTVEAPEREAEVKKERGPVLAENRLTAEERKAETEKKMEEYRKRIDESMKKLDRAADERGEETKPEPDPAAEARRQEEEAIRRREEERKADIARRKQENDKRIEEGLKKLEEAGKPEAARKAEAAKREAERRVEEERRTADARRIEQAKRMTAEAERERKAVEAKLAAEEARRVEQEKRAAEKADEDRRAADAKRRAEEARQAEEAKRAAAKAEGERRAAEARRAEDEKRRLAAAVPASRPELKLPKADAGEQQAAEASAASEEEPPVEAAQPPEDDVAPARKTIEKKRKAKAAAKRSRRAHVRAASMRKAALYRHRGARKTGDRCRRYKAQRVRYTTRHVVRRGDTLWRIAKRYYKCGRRYEIVYRANRSKVHNPNLIYPGQRLYIAQWTR